MRNVFTRLLLAVFCLFLGLTLLALAGCGGGGGDSDNHPAPDRPLSEFYGRLTLNYKFDINSTIFTDVAYFSSADLSSDEETVTTMVDGSSSRGIACGKAPSFRSHMCAILDITDGTKEIFLFDLNDGQISRGLYEYCFADVTTEECAAEVVLTPDGTVWGNVVPGVVKGAILNNESNTSSDDASKAMLKLNVDGVSATAQELSSEQQQEVNKLSTRIEQLGNQVTGTLR